MMTDPTLYVTMAGSGLTATAILAIAALRGWRGWLDLKRLELEQGHREVAPPSAGSRIEIADLKERIRKLEAIAAGVDL